MITLRALVASMSWLTLAACSNNNGAAPGPTPEGGTPGDESDGATASPPLLSVVTSRFPAANAESVCADAPLRLSFSSAPTVGNTGKIQIFKANDPATAVDVIDLSSTLFTDTINGRVFRITRPVFVDGSDAVVYPHLHALLPNETYFVTIDAGVFLDGAGQPLGSIVDPMAWRFSTGTPAPANPASLVVEREGAGDFCRVQGAIDFLPAMNATPVTINIKTGTYHEIVYISRKNNITLLGEDRKNSVITYANNDMLQTADGGAGGTRFRAMVEVENVTGFVVENMTLRNTTPQGGSQAEALRVEPGEQVILRNADFISRQDTLLLTGHVYVTGCYVEGNVDFIWGQGTVYFDHCELKTVVRTGYEVQARNGPGIYGYVFVDSKLTADPGITGNRLGRIDSTVYPGSNVAYINCEMGPHILPAGWLVTGAPDAGTVRFWEYQSTDPGGQPLDVSMRVAPSRQLTDEEAAMMRDKATVLGGWTP